jgi:ABC-2 type transport system permease protein
MKTNTQAIVGGLRAELSQLRRSPLLLALVVIQAITFLWLVSLFGLTGSRAPTALVVDDSGRYATQFIADLAAAHHSFALQRMSLTEAQAALQRGELVAIVTIPATFSQSITTGTDTGVQVTIDNINTDLTDDIQRALPSAIATFGQQEDLPNIHVRVAEVDLINHDTNYIAYLVVSALVLDAFLVSCTLSAIAVAREFETKAIDFLAMAPTPPQLVLFGRVLATSGIAFCAILITLGIVVFGYQVMPSAPLAVLALLAFCVVLFGVLGAVLGALLKRTLAVAALVFGLALPLYLSAGSLEPIRFDGNGLWLLAHFSPLYYAVGVMQSAYHGLQVTPESLGADMLALVGWLVLALACAGWIMPGRKRS